MLYLDLRHLVLQEERNRQHAQRHRAGLRARPARPNTARRRLGAWIVRLGRSVGGRPATATGPA